MILKLHCTFFWLRISVKLGTISEILAKNIFFFLFPKRFFKQNSTKMLTHTLDWRGRNFLRIFKSRVVKIATNMLRLAKVSYANSPKVASWRLCALLHWKKGELRALAILQADLKKWRLKKHFKIKQKWVCSL